MKKLVLIGGGHAHVEVLRQFGLRKHSGVEVTLVSPDRHTPYSGMLPGLVAGHYSFDESHIDLPPLADYAGARVVLAQAVRLDAARRVLTLSNGDAIAYDIASINVGSTPITGSVAGAAQHALMIKPVAEFLTNWATLVERVRVGAVKSVAVVGGGAAGVEILLAMHYRFAQMTPHRKVQCILLTDAPEVLAQHATAVRKQLVRNLARKGIAVHCATRVARVEAGALTADGVEQRVSADAIIWVTGAAPPAWLESSGLALNDRKFIDINQYLQSTSQAEVFAAGDCSTIAGVAYPKSGVYAVRQGPVLAENLRRALSVEALLAYTPQKRALALISTGERHAIASWGPLSVHGNWVWQWKDRIDQAFIAKYRNLNPL